MTATRLRRATALVAALSVLGLASGCQSMGETFAGYYDAIFSSSKDKPAKLVNFTPTASVNVLWKDSVGDARPYVFSPALDDGAIYATAAKGAVNAFGENGRELWTNYTNRAVSGGVGARDDYVLVGTRKGQVIALDGRGRERWIAQVSSEVLASPQYADGVVVVRSGDGRIYGLNAADGTRKWVYQRGTPALTVRSFGGVVVNRGAVFAGYPGGKLVALNLQNGALGWEGTVAQPRGATELERVADVTSLPVLDGTLLCAVAYQGRIACFDASRGTPVWARDVSSFSGLAIAGAAVYVTDDRGAVIALDKNSGSSLWKQDKLTDRRVSGPLVFRNYVVVGDLEGVVHVINRDDGSFAARITTDGSAIVATPIALENAVLVQTRKGGLFAIDVQ
ncbi:MAG TPA: outer membrane protein assembly factor BamB [Burkholderiales bacterium]|nr:outer membrane protein assembly factor BamB [Betaproteobacteria bacterium]HQR52222.1 outer membrane protein assembly factor BamB [Burkholderiales bacterium]